MNIIFTSAIIAENYNIRKKEYLKSFEYLNTLNIPIYIVECYSKSPTFWDEISNIYYTNTHDIKYRNKGVKEILGLKAFFSNYRFEDDEMLIKQTGRYLLMSSDIINDIKNDKLSDVFVKYGSDGVQVFTGFFAIRFGIFKKFLDMVDIESMENNMINIERLLSDFLQSEKNLKIKIISNINLYSNINNMEVVIW